MNTININIDIRLDIIARKGENFSKTIIVKNENGSNYDFTGHTVTLECYRNESEPTPDLIFNTANGLTLAAGQIILSKTSAAMSLQAREFIYFLKVTDSFGVKKVWLNGLFFLHAGLLTNNNSETTTLTINTSGSPLTLTLFNTLLAPIPVENFTQVLQFNRDKELAFNQGGALSFSIAASGHLNGMGIIMKLNKPTSVAFVGAFEAFTGSQNFDSTKMNVVTLVYIANYDGQGNPKVLYNNVQLTGI